MILTHYPHLLFSWDLNISLDVEETGLPLELSLLSERGDAFPSESCWTSWVSGRERESRAASSWEARQGMEHFPVFLSSKFSFNPLSFSVCCISVILYHYFNLFSNIWSQLIWLIVSLNSFFAELHDVLIYGCCKVKIKVWTW